MADQGGAQAAAEAATEAARVAELGRQLYEASWRGQAAEVVRLLALGAPTEHKGGDWQHQAGELELPAQGGVRP